MRRRYKKKEENELPGSVGRPSNTTRQKEAIKLEQYLEVMRWLREESKLREKYIVRYERCFTMLFITGQRCSELRLITVGDLLHGMEKKFFSLVNDTKTGAPRKCLLGPLGMELLHKHFEMFLVDDGTFKSREKVFSSPLDPTRMKAMNMATLNTDLNDILHACFKSDMYSTHGFRVSYITDLIQVHKIPIKTVSKLVGHSSVSVTLGYSLVSEDEMTDAISLSR